MDRNGQQSPRFQIWRASDTQPGVYYKPGLDVLIFDDSPVCLRDRLDGEIFRCTLNEAFQVSVQPGDILGLELPPEIDDDFDIYYIEQGPENYVFEGRLTSTANLSEANRVTSHMPQINFTVMLGNIIDHYHSAHAHNIILYDRLITLYTHTHTHTHTNSYTYTMGTEYLAA